MWDSTKGLEDAVSWCYEQPVRRFQWSVASKAEHGVHRWRPDDESRRHMVQACRALRMQIKSFEDDFQSSNGHLPRGSERQPLASTYRQYRQWKRDIRDHAALQIQALVRSKLARRRKALRLLLHEKRHLKQQLKDYDHTFLQTHGRLPQKHEKEPIRDLYELYHSIKAQLADLSGDHAS